MSGTDIVTVESATATDFPSGYHTVADIFESSIYGILLTVILVDAQGNVQTIPTTLTLKTPSHTG